MKKYIILIRKAESNPNIYWGTVRGDEDNLGDFVYDTKLSESKKEILKDCREFCKFKKIKNVKIIDRTKGE